MVRYRRVWAISALVAIAVLVLAATVLSTSHSMSLSVSCDSLGINSRNYPLTEPSFDYACGRLSASDGRLSITLNDYRFAAGGNIDWQCSGAVVNGSSGCSSSGVYLLVNATIGNVGVGNASIGPDFQVWLNDSGDRAVENGEYGASATFPGQYPDSSVPAQSGGTYLSPNGKVTYWFIFYMPNVALKDAQNLRLQYLVWPEISYGGTWRDGGFDCPCLDTHVQLVVLGQPAAIS